MSWALLFNEKEMLAPSYFCTSGWVGFVDWLCGIRFHSDLCLTRCVPKSPHTPMIGHRMRAEAWITTAESRRTRNDEADRCQSNSDTMHPERDVLRSASPDRWCK